MKETKEVEEYTRCDADYVKSQSPVIPIQTTKYKCSQCKFEFNSIDLLKVHFFSEHPKEEFSYLTSISPKKKTSLEKAIPNVGNQKITKSTSKVVKTTYKCPDCYFVSENLLITIKHIKKHYVTYACPECDSLNSAAFKIRNHILNEHPGSELQPIELKGSEKDIENSKMNIIVNVNGRKRKISVKEITEVHTIASNENSPVVKSPAEEFRKKSHVRETARKSTGSPKKIESASFTSQELGKSGKGLLSLLVNIPQQNKVFKLPADVFKEIFDIDGRPKLDDQPLSKNLTYHKPE